MKKYDFGLNFVSILFDFVYHKYETLQNVKNLGIKFGDIG